MKKNSKKSSVVEFSENWYFLLITKMVSEKDNGPNLAVRGQVFFPVDGRGDSAGYEAVEQRGHLVVHGVHLT